MSVYFHQDITQLTESADVELKHVTEYCVRGCLLLMWKVFHEET